MSTRVQNMVWVPDADWRPLEPGDLRRCRRCDQTAVAVLYRSHKGDLPRPWGYCHEHMYGREIIRGVVHVQLPAESPAARRGYSMQKPAR